MENTDNKFTQPGHLSPFAANRVRKIFFIFVFGLLMGALMGFFANVFVTAVTKISSYRENINVFSVQVGGYEYNYLPVITLLTAAFLIISIKQIFKIDRWNGPADSIYAAHRTDNELDIRVGYLSSLTALISASGGAAIGLYGPLVHLGATIGTTLKKLTRELLSIDVFLGCGVAGAISAGFGAPLAGIIFAHEAILRHFSMRALAPIAIASFTSSAVTEKIFNKESALETALISPELSSILPASLICSPIFALVAIIFMITMRWFIKTASRTALSPSTLIFSGAIICGVTGVFFPQVLGLGTESILTMLSGEFSFYFVVIVLILKILMTSICLSSGLFGGIFAPALFIGTAAGSILGKSFYFVGFTNAAAILPFCGMAAVGGAIIGAPVTAVLIILEMTGSYEIGVATMASVAGCCLITHLFFGHSFFDRQLMDRGINVHLGRGHLKLMAEPVNLYVSQDFCSIKKSCSVEESIKKLLESNLTEGYILDSNKCFMGKVLITELIKSNEKPGESESLETLFVKDPLILASDLSVLQSIEACRSFVGESIPVVENSTNQFVGVISEADLFSAYLDLDKQIKDLESG